MFCIPKIHGSPQYLNETNLTIVKPNTRRAPEPTAQDITNHFLPTFNPQPQI